MICARRKSAIGADSCLHLLYKDNDYVRPSRVRLSLSHFGEGPPDSSKLPLPDRVVICLDHQPLLLLGVPLELPPPPPPVLSLSGTSSHVHEISSFGAALSLLEFRCLLPVSPVFPCALSLSASCKCRSTWLWTCRRRGTPRALLADRVR